ncbi:hypothetical protein Xmau_01417 [Xenorhabdus mauleonii]|uniref:Uncharacterized protein n=1 Tax=Xenorhabdus mauleonii TaxID=351675 RepID=A0A1I3KZQ4_9GAMM|nr:hypothetical protein Xmau_01417 [Xenorhabdus mauleonii]SFI77963.1 hypothetical protein SAMN05421680_103246 [Xenorhabdus mauleonii]
MMTLMEIWIFYKGIYHIVWIEGFKIESLKIESSKIDTFKMHNAVMI